MTDFRPALPERPLSHIVAADIPRGPWARTLGYSIYNAKVTKVAVLRDKLSEEIAVDPKAELEANEMGGKKGICGGGERGEGSTQGGNSPS